MVKRSLSPWLEDFISTEIKQVIDWRALLDDVVKPDPDSRFEDDGSNFRSVTTDMPTHCLVQLVEVLLVKAQPIVIISDGHTRVKARLSQAAVAVLEDEAGAKFTEDMTNDVFLPKSLTIISTTFGTPDGFVQLDIGDIEYEHHLRRAEGQPTPVEEHERVRVLLHDINQIRCAGLPSADPPDCDTVEAAFDSPRSNVSQQSQQPKTPQGNVTDPVSVSESPPATQANGVRVGIPSFQTQRSTPRKQLGPSLAKDGFEVETGLNLDRPVQAASNEAPDTNVATHLQGNAAPNTQLLGLLAGRTGQKRPRQPSPPFRANPATVSGNPLRTQIGGNRTQDSESTLESGVRPPSTAAAPSSQPPPKETQASLRSSAGSCTPYGRRQIPANQRKLLERKECWMPPNPGHTFPSPNVPVELLTRWNALMRSAPRSSQTVPAKDDADNAGTDDGLPSGVAESADSSDSDKEFGPSQWGSSPPPALPPDSSFENVVRGTQQDDLEVAPPRVMPTKRATAATSLRHQLPPKPVVVSSPQDHSSWKDFTGDDGTARSQLRGSSTDVPALTKSQRSRPSRERYESQEYGIEEPSPRRLSGRDAVETCSDHARSHLSSVQSNRRPPSPQVVLNRRTEEDLSQPLLERSPSGVWSTQLDTTVSGRGAAHDYATSISPPSSSRCSTAISPPTGPKTMNGTFERDHRRHWQAETPSQPSPSQPRSAVDKSAESSQWPNMPMTGRRTSGVYPNSSPQGPAATESSTVAGTPSRTRRPATSVVPATQLADTRSRSAEDTYGDRSSPRHVDRYVPNQRSSTDQHPDQRYREIRRDYIWHSRRRDWLQNNFVLDTSGNVPFETVFCAYRVYHTHETKSDDFVTRHKLQHAVEEAFLDGETLPLEAMFTAKDCLREKMISKQGAIDRRQDGLSHPHLSVPDPFRSAQKREKGAKEDPTNKGISRETVEDSYTDAQSIEGGRAEATAPRAEEAVARVAPNAAVVTEGGEEDGDRAGRPQGATTMEASSTRAERGAASTRGGGAEKFGVSARQRVGDGNADEEDDEGELENLARKWLDIKSGGAFARPQPQQRRRRKVDVLRWGV